MGWSISVSDSHSLMYINALYYGAISKYNNNTQIYASIIYIYMCTYSLLLVSTLKGGIQIHAVPILKIAYKTECNKLTLTYRIYNLSSKKKKESFFIIATITPLFSTFFLVGVYVYLCILWPLLFYFIFFFTLLSCSFDGVYHFRK